jgi:deoxyribonuclease-4
MSSLKFGAHTGVAGGLHNGLYEGKEIGCDAVQIFTSSPRQWYAKPLTDEAIRLFQDAAKETGIAPRIAHDSYLINLASPSEETRTKSLDAFVAELERCEALGLDFLVSHPGAHLGEGEDIGIATIARSLDEAHRRCAGFSVKVALETTAAKGTTLGGKLEHFPQIFSRVNEAERLVVCVDTCHLFDAGYDIRDSKAFWDEFEQVIGLEKLAVCHANDSKFGLGSHRDHHAHIGEGTLGDAAFTAFLTDPRLPDGLPVIVETPVDEDKGHRENVARLRALICATTV